MLIGQTQFLVTWLLSCSARTMKSLLKFDIRSRLSSPREMDGDKTSSKKWHSSYVINNCSQKVDNQVLGTYAIKYLNFKKIIFRHLKTTMIYLLYILF